MTNPSRSVPIFLPSFGASIEEGTVVSWRVSVGDTVRAGQVIADIETEKALVELEATEDGVISAIVVPEGSTPVKVGTTIARLTRLGEEAERKPGGKEPGDAAAIAPRDADRPTHVADSGDRHSPDRPGGRQTGERKGPMVADDVGPARVSASPRARRLARESGRSVHQISGSGPDGRVVGRDLETTSGSREQPGFRSGASQADVSSPAAVSPSLTALGFAPGSYDLVPLTGMRKTIAHRLSESFREVPHYSLTVDVDLDELLRQRDRLNETLAAAKLSINDFFIWAAAAALKDVPEANASYTEEGIALHRHAHIAVAVAIGGGLVTPVVRAAETKSLHEIAAEMRQLKERARARKLERAEFEGGTFTLSNLGMVGIQSFTSVLNPPQGCILSVGAAEQRAIVRDGAIAIATMATMTLTCDHRVVDGVVGAEFLSALRTHLKTPSEIADQ